MVYIFLNTTKILFGFIKNAKILINQTHMLVILKIAICFNKKHDSIISYHKYTGITYNKNLEELITCIYTQ